MFNHSIQEKIEAWLDGNYDSMTKRTIRKMQATSPDQLADAFATNLSFGTAGIRGLMGVGTNRLNIYTIRQVTQGIANYVRRSFPDISEYRVVIGYDSRHHSQEFAHEAARVFASNAIIAHYFPEIRPTPYTSFACRHLGCHAAIMITASHNSKEYNGYKVYWSDGGQVVPPHDLEIMEEVAKITTPEMVRLTPSTSAWIRETSSEVDAAYLAAIASMQHELTPQLATANESLKIAYTSLHGTGITLIGPALASWGFQEIEYVTQQVIPDGDFPTTPHPNPEDPTALKMGIDLMQKRGCDLLFAHDPDADRLGVVVSHKMLPITLSGNEIAAICTDYLINHKQKLSPRDAIVTTIVSTPLLGKIAHAAGIAYFEVLTGFKYIGEKIHEWEALPEAPRFLFGAEESCGFLFGTFSRDKDALISSCLIAAIARYNKRLHRSLVDHLYLIYHRFGIHREATHSIAFPASQEGLNQISKLMQKTRADPPQELCGEKVLMVNDYLAQQTVNLITGEVGSLSLPKSNVLAFHLENGWRLTLRPSGTEPKIKIYGSVCLPPGIGSPSECDATLAALLYAAEQELSLS
jgi:phosphoglucomutase/phosphomannomutase